MDAALAVAETFDWTEAIQPGMALFAAITTAGATSDKVRKAVRPGEVDAAARAEQEALDNVEKQAEESVKTMAKFYEARLVSAGWDVGDTPNDGNPSA